MYQSKSFPLFGWWACLDWRIRYASAIGVLLLAGVSAARSAGLTVVATSVLTRSSFRVIGALPQLIVGRGIAAWQVMMPRAAGRAQADFDRVLPRLALALPFALHAIDRAAKLGLAAYVAGAPLCLVGPFAARAVDGDGPRAYAELCDRCPARPDRHACREDGPCIDPGRCQEHLAEGPPVAVAVELGSHVLDLLDKGFRDRWLRLPSPVHQAPGQAQQLTGPDRADTVEPGWPLPH